MTFSTPLIISSQGMVFVVLVKYPRIGQCSDRSAELSGFQIAFLQTLNIFLKSFGKDHLAHLNPQVFQGIVHRIKDFYIATINYILHRSNGFIVCQRAIFIDQYWER